MVEAVALEFVMLIAQRSLLENPLVLNLTAVGELPSRSIVDGEVVNQTTLPLVHAPPAPPAVSAQFAPLQRPDAPPTQY
jgi:hypothetical protein